MLLHYIGGRKKWCINVEKHHLANVDKLATVYEVDKHRLHYTVRFSLSV